MLIICIISGPGRSRGLNRSRGLGRQSGLSPLNRANTKVSRMPNIRLYIFEKHKKYEWVGGMNIMNWKKESCRSYSKIILTSHEKQQHENTERSLKWWKFFFFPDRRATSSNHSFSKRLIPWERKRERKRTWRIKQV